MAQPVQFLKVSGAGNDFVLVDNMNSLLSLDWSELARSVTPRRSGIGADGLLVLEQSDRASFRMRYFNADGSFGGMCGNGGRCAARYAAERGIAGHSLTFEACDSIYTADVRGSEVRLGMTDIGEISPLTEFRLEESMLKGWIIDTGSPHVVFEEQDLDRVPVGMLGPKIRNHHLVSSFGGANVNFVSYTPGRSIRIRTYERGVEGETLACGTGAVAAAAVAVFRGLLRSPVSVIVQSGEELKVSLRKEGERFTDVWLEGSAYFLYAGMFYLDPAGERLAQATIEPGGHQG